MAVHVPAGCMSGLAPVLLSPQTGEPRRISPPGPDFRTAGMVLPYPQHQLLRHQHQQWNLPQQYQQQHSSNGGGVGKRSCAAAMMSDSNRTLEGQQLAYQGSPDGQLLAYQTLLERLPVNPTQKSIMAAFLRDELREMLKMHRLSYHKPGPDCKVRRRNTVEPGSGTGHGFSKRNPPP